MHIAIPNSIILNLKQQQFLQALNTTLHVYENPEELSTIPIDIWVGNNHPQNLDGIQFIQVLSSGTDTYKLDRIKEKGIKFCNARGVYGIPIAEYCLAQVLAIYKNLSIYTENQKKLLWDKSPTQTTKTLDGKIILILGTGDIGQESAKRFKAFNSTVYGVNSDGRLINPFDECFPLAQLHNCLPQADIVLMSLPVNHNTLQLMKKEEFLLMKKDAVLINVGRGSCLVLDDLYSVLDYHLNTVVLDVFETEPLDENHPIWKHKKAILTPHVSFASEKLKENWAELVCKNISNYINNQPLINQIF